MAQATPQQAIDYIRQNGPQFGISVGDSDYVNQRIARGLQARIEGAKNPKVAALIASGGSGEIKNAFGDADIHVENGQITKIDFGGWGMPLLAAASVIGGGALASGLIGPGLGAGAGSAGSSGSYIGGDVASTAAASGGGSAAAVGGGAAASGIGSRLLQAGVAAGVPLALQQMAGRSGGASSLTDAQQANQAQLTDLLSMMKDRYQKTVPIHDAAMKLAGQLAPSGDNSRVLAALEQSRMPAPAAQINPQVSELMRRLMAGRS